MVLEAVDVEAINKQTTQKGRGMGEQMGVVFVNKFRFMGNIVL